MVTTQTIVSSQPQTTPSLDLRGQLQQEISKSLSSNQSQAIGRLLSAIYRQQAEVLDPSSESLFILWREFKFEHQPLFAEAFAKLLVERLAGNEIGAIIGVPDSATWLLASLKDYFPTAQFPLCTKTPPDDVATHIIDSLTYTKRDEDGNRLAIQLALEPFDTQRGMVLVVEDIFARGESGILFLEGLKAMGVGEKQVITAGVVEMPQGGRNRLAAHPLTREVYAPIVVTGVTGKGFGQILTEA